MPAGGEPVDGKGLTLTAAGRLFRKEGSCPSLECLVQTVDLGLTGVWRGERRQEAKRCFQSGTGLSSFSTAPIMAGGAAARGAIWEDQSSWMCRWSTFHFSCTVSLPSGDQWQGWSCRLLDVLHLLKSEQMTELPQSLPGPLGSLC